MTVELLAPIPLDTELIAVYDKGDSSLSWIVDWKTLNTRIAGPFRNSDETMDALIELKGIQAMTRRLTS